jgi:hypothetical protein
MYYIYILFDPRTRRPFYVGKGKGKRARQHLWNLAREQNAYKTNVILDIRRNGFEPGIVYARSGIEHEDEAYDIERRVIEFWGRKGYDPGGCLANVCLDQRPPTLKGRSYVDIYGSEEAASAQIEKRLATKRRNGNHGGVRFHTAETKAKLRAAAPAAIAKRDCARSKECRKRISQALSGRTGAKNIRAQKMRLVSPTGEEHTLFGKAELVKFCREFDLSYNTFLFSVSKGWGPARKGKNVGWTFSVEDGH